MLQFEIQQVNIYSTIYLWPICIWNMLQLTVYCVNKAQKNGGNRFFEVSNSSSTLFLFDPVFHMEQIDHLWVILFLAWTVGRICEIISEAVVNEQYLNPLLHALVEGLRSEPRVATNVCWVSLVKALYSRNFHGEIHLVAVISFQEL